MFSSVLCLLCLCARLFICALRSHAGKGLTLGSRLWCLTLFIHRVVELYVVCKT